MRRGPSDGGVGVPDLIPGRQERGPQEDVQYGFHMKPVDPLYRIGQRVQIHIFAEGVLQHPGIGGLKAKFNDDLPIWQRLTDACQDLRRYGRVVGLQDHGGDAALVHRV